MSEFNFKTLDEKFLEKWSGTEKIYADEVKEVVNEFCQYLSKVLNNTKSVEERDGARSWTFYIINKNIDYLKLYNNYCIKISIQPVYNRTSQLMPSIKDKKPKIILETNFIYNTKAIESNGNNLRNALIQTLFLNESPEIREIIQIYLNSMSKEAEK